MRNFNLFSCIYVSYCLQAELLRSHFSYRVVKVQTRNNSVVKWVVLVTCVFLLCYGIFLRCSLLFLTGHKL